MKSNASKKILIKPLLTEKSVRLATTENQYTFIVNNSAAKIEIAQEVAKRFNVKVENVAVTNILGKKVTWGKERTPGKKQDYKKAIIKLKKGDKISLFEIK